MAAALLLVSLMVSTGAQADVIITLAPAPGTDLSNIRVGDDIVFNSFASSTDPGEFLTSFPDIHILGSGFMTFVSGALAPSWQDPLTGNPLIAVWTLHVFDVGSNYLFNGWPDCVGLPADNTGCAITNLGSYRPEDSNYVRFESHPAVPEPGSLVLFGTGLMGLGRVLRRKLIG